MSDRPFPDRRPSPWSKAEPLFRRTFADSNLPPEKTELFSSPAAGHRQRERLRPPCPRQGERPPPRIGSGKFLQICYEYSINFPLCQAVSICEPKIFPKNFAGPPAESRQNRKAKEIKKRQAPAAPPLPFIRLRVLNAGPAFNPDPDRECRWRPGPALCKGWPGCPAPA